MSRSQTRQRVRKGFHPGRAGRGHRDHRRPGGVRRAQVPQLGRAVEGGGGVLLPVGRPRRRRSGTPPARAPTPPTSPTLDISFPAPKYFTVGADHGRRHRDLAGELLDADPDPHRGVGRLRRLHRDLHRPGLRLDQQHDRRLSPRSTRWAPTPTAARQTARASLTTGTDAGLIGSRRRAAERSAALSHGRTAPGRGEAVMKSLVAQAVALRKTIGLYIGDREVVLSLVAHTAAGAGRGRPPRRAVRAGAARRGARGGCWARTATAAR